MNFFSQASTVIANPYGAAPIMAEKGRLGLRNIAFPTYCSLLHSSNFCTVCAGMRTPRSRMSGPCTATPPAWARSRGPAPSRPRPTTCSSTKGTPNQSGHIMKQRNQGVAQCCKSGIIYSGSGSSYEFFEFRIQPVLFKLI